MALLRIVVKRFCEAMIVYTSWNGSTETALWQVLSGPMPNRLSTAPRTGFETDIYVNSVGPYFQVKALNECVQIIVESRIAYV